MEGSVMVVRLYAVACIALASLLLGGNGVALAGNTNDSPQSDDSYAKPDTAEEPAAPDDGAAPPQEEDDSGAATPDDNGGDDANAPSEPDEPD
jgi:hypothetical protein